MVKFVDEELKRIRKEVLEMWTLVYDQLQTVCEAVLTADKDRAWDVLIREKRVNASELKLDCDVEDFLVLYNPVAIDLRFVLAMSRINCDLERIGDFAEGIARFVIKSEGDTPDTELFEKLRFKEMADRVLDMLSTTKESLEKEDLGLANSVFAKDKLVDDINAAVTPALVEYAQAHPDKLTYCFNLKSVFLRLERAGDHVSNLAEEIVFYIDAEVLKHSADNAKIDKALAHRIDEGQN